MGKNFDRNDIVGQCVGKLKIEEWVGFAKDLYQPRNCSYYRCRCDCGNEVIVPRSQLVQKRKVSCGSCRQIIHEDGFCRYLCKAGENFLFDETDLPLVASHTWHMNNFGYAVTRINRKMVLLTHFLFGVERGYIDHINGDKTDNRRRNLRIASNHENCRNSKLYATNTTGYKGVSYFKSRSKYRATIKVNYKQIHLGYYDTPEEAAGAYDKAARFYFGEFACVNFPLPGEQCCRRNQSEAV